MKDKRQRLELDQVSKEPVLRDFASHERDQYYFGEDVGILVFRPWYPGLAIKGHQAFAPTYDFPVRLKFVDDPFDSAGYHQSREGWWGWNLPNWIKAAKELEEEGVRAIVGGCGLTGSLQLQIANAVSIPVYMSSLLFVEMMLRNVGDGKRIGIMTVSEDQLTAHDNVILRNCGISDDMPIAIAGMNESDESDDWLTLTTDRFDPSRIEKAVVNTACALIEEHPDIGGIVLECTDMPPYANAIRTSTGLPVFDPVDMVLRARANIYEKHLFKESRKAS